jgi:hypothetical protein
MSALSRLIPSLLDVALSGGRDRLRGLYLRVLLVVLAGLVAALGLAMLAGSAFLALAVCMTAPAAAAVTGGGLLVAAGLIVLGARLLRRRRSRRPTRGPTTSAAAAIADLLSAAEAAIARDARAETPSFAVTALLIGCAIGASPQLRRAIFDLAAR